MKTTTAALFIGLIVNVIPCFGAQLSKSFPIAEVEKSYNDLKETLEHCHLTLTFTPKSVGDSKEPNLEQLQEFAKNESKLFRHNRRWISSGNASDSHWLESHYVFDGKRMASEEVYTKPGSAPNIQPAVITPNLSENKVLGGNYYLDAIGGVLYEGKNMLPWLYCAEMPAPDQPFSFPASLARGNLRSNALTENVNNYECLVGTLNEVDEFYLGTAINYSIVKRVWTRKTTHGTTIRITINNSDFDQFGSNYWFPRSSEIKVEQVSQTGTGKIVLEGLLSLTSASFGADVDERLFEITFEAGKDILDASLAPPGQGGTPMLQYAAGSTPEATQANLEKAKGNVAPTTKVAWFIPAAVVVLSIAIGAAYFTMRRSK